MDTSIATILAVAIVAVSGFVFLSWTMFVVWKNLGKRKDSLFSTPVDGTYLEDPVSPDECYDACMKRAGWNTTQAHACARECKW
jgi:hypothetical protein